MKIEIKSRWDASVLFSIEKESIKLAVEAAVKSRADLTRANLTRANLTDAYLTGAYLAGANLTGAYLTRANLRSADLTRANLTGAYLTRADLTGADLRSANLTGANLTDAKNMYKIMGVEAGNCYWKRFDEGLKNNDYQFKVGPNALREGERFADDERVVCDYPAFHFASRSWCAMFYPDRPLEAKILIPRDAKINEPWNTDGKASADKIEILQVFDVKTGEDVTEQYRGTNP